MAELEYFRWYNSYGKRLAKLSDQEVGRLVRALSMYNETGETQELAGRESVAFDFIASDIDQAKEEYRKKCMTNKNNRKRPSTVDNDRKRPSKESTTVDESPPPLAPPSPSPPHSPIPNPLISPLPLDDDTRTREMVFRPAVPTDPKIAVVFTAYAEKIGQKSPITEKIRDELLAFLEAMGPDCCIRAMDEAVEAGAISWRYVRKVLSNKRDQGVRSITDWDEAEKKRAEKVSKGIASGTDFQPSAERIQKSNEWLEKFLKEQEGEGWKERDERGLQA